MRRHIAAMVLLLAGCASQPAGEAPPATAPTAATPAAGERVVAPPPVGWHLAFTDDKPDVLLQEYVPDGQTVDSWTDMVTVITFRRFAQQPLTYFANALAQVSVNGCAARPSIGRPQDLSVSYPVMFQMVACPTTKRWGSAEVLMARTMKGDEASYQVQRAWRMPARETVQELSLPKETLDAGAGYLAGTYVCSSRSAKMMPCPP